MSLFDDKLKKITLKEVLCLIIVLFLIQYLSNALNIVHIDSVWIYILIIFYFIFKLKGEIRNVGPDICRAMNPDLLKTIFLVVMLNIFFSYGMLYLSDAIMGIVPSFNSMSGSFLTGGLIATVIISPISEELIFRGVFLNRLRLIVPTVFAVLVSSLMFASLHSFGFIFSAFIFGISVSILYLKTDNIFVAMLAHFLNNLIAEIVVFIDSNNVLFTNTLAIGVMSVLAIVSFVILFMSIIGQFKMLNNNEV